MSYWFDYNRFAHGVYQLTAFDYMYYLYGIIHYGQPNGGFAEYVVASENAFKIPDDVEWEVEQASPQLRKHHIMH